MLYNYKNNLTKIYRKFLITIIITIIGCKTKHQNTEINDLKTSPNENTHSSEKTFILVKFNQMGISIRLPQNTIEEEYDHKRILVFLFYPLRKYPRADNEFGATLRITKKNLDRFTSKTTGSGCGQWEDILYFKLVQKRTAYSPGYVFIRKDIPIPNSKFVYSVMARVNEDALHAREIQQVRNIVQSIKVLN